ncbi:8-amino-7-oxononanoate synthase [Halomonas sp. MCCC 1A17488]|uniref:8-amino-7-oxononanoate synthase n=1 Tax=Billgrantia sulfidoxydans TaxID=2733484 RepID=A0ABX7W6L3_9GAMM|nr:MULTISPECIES: 8-amino-7-oxononanoate synthase [Halomonas]MCE8014660.1 8-amino-7-oxononanoate synthase [Halomonas sp. MCCC 1A17488]MCG3237993.1 8-amino-7-oxononanoate synthase [Halomonas sp. MCCC 1A17488]QPP48226.1 8-amino-7-oxononanoate synthase [Halomonas sp. SS10-MC5]QTP55526.1 8-amino-7-oxononanoate synthase [Halomonas sulfidoxydans]
MASSPQAWPQRLADAATWRRAQGLWRERLTSTRGMLDFAGNDYLGLAADPRLAKAQAAGARRLGAGAGASHLVSGHLEVHEALERRLAELVGRPRALLFSTGYMANLGTLQALCDSETQVFQDRLNHASLLDGAKLAGARSRRFHHRDLDDLDRLLARAPSEAARLVVSDGVFSMDGDVANIGGLAEISARHGAWLMIDDAHGLGVLGAHGDGCVGRAHGVEHVAVLVGTLGKALGTGGAFVAGSEALIEHLIQFARPYVYTTAQPPGVAAATLAALDVIAAEPERRERLRDNIAYFRHEAARLDLPLTDSFTPIQPLVLGESEAALRWAGRLREAGLQVGAIRPPTVPRGEARLRITLRATHDRECLDRLLEALARLPGEITR